MFVNFQTRESTLCHQFKSTLLEIEQATQGHLVLTYPVQLSKTHFPIKTDKVSISGPKNLGYFHLGRQTSNPFALVANTMGRIANLAYMRDYLAPTFAANETEVIWWRRFRWWRRIWRRISRLSILCLGLRVLVRRHDCDWLKELEVSEKIAFRESFVATFIPAR